MNNRFYTIQDAANILGVSTKTLRRWDQRGRLVPTRTVGNQRRYTQEQIQEFKVQSSKFKVSQAPASETNQPLFDLNSAPKAPKANHDLPSALSSLPSGSFLKNHFLLKHASVVSQENESRKEEANSVERLKIEDQKSNKESKANPIKMGVMFATLVLMLSLGGTFVLTKYNVVAGLNQAKRQFAKLVNNLPKINLKTGSQQRFGSEETRDISFVPQDLAGSVLAAATGGSDLVLNINVPAFFSQQVGIGTATPETSAILDLASEDRGFLAPRMTEVQMNAIPTPAAGLFVYNTTTNHYNMYNGTAWQGVFTAIGDSTLGEAFTATGTEGNSLYFHGTGGGVGQLTAGAISGTQTYTFPNATGEISLLGQTISNAELVNSKITISPGTNITGGGDVALGGSVTITLKDSISLAGTLTVSGASTLTGATTVAGATALNGNVGLGDETSDAITFTGRVAQGSSLIPITATGTNDLGSLTLPWDNIYVDNVIAGSSGTSGFWQRNSSALSPTNITDDVLIGATSTSSAKFGFINMAGGTPTATISGNLSLAVPTTAGANTFNILNNSTLNFQRSPGGNAGLTTALFIQNDGNIGIATTSATSKVRIVESLSNASNNVGGATEYLTLSKNTTTNAQNFGLGFYSNLGNQFVASGVTDTGYALAIRGDAFASNAGFAGTLTNQYGGEFRAGFETAASGAVVTNAFGGSFSILNRATGTTITNAYGVYIDNTETTGTITNRYDLYASSSNAKNYFAGNVGIGTTVPLVALDVAGSASLSANVSLRGSGTAHNFDILDNGSLNIRKSIGGDAGVATVMYFQNSGNIGIGTTSPASKLHVSKDGTVPSTALYNGSVEGILLTANGASTGIRIITGVDDATSGTSLVLVKARGTVASPTVVQNGDLLGLITAQGYDGTTRQDTASIQMAVDAGPGSGDMPGRLTFLTTPDGSSTLAERMRIDNQGNVGIGQTTPLTALDVTGSASLSANLSLRGSGTAHTFNILQNGSLNFQRSIGGDAGLATALYIQNSGNIGIGNTAPGTTLDITGTLRNSGAVTFSTFTSNGGPLYTNGSGAVAQVTAGTASQCLLGGTTPSFGSCGAGETSDTFWNQSSGALYPNNSTVDLLIGAQSTASAKFAFINVNSGNPTATISGNLSLAVPTTAGANTFNLLNNSTLNFQRSIGGDAGLATQLFLQNSGNVGIGTTAPAGLLALAGGNFLQTALNPTVKGSVNSTTQLANAYSVYVQGKYAYVAALNNNALTIVDVSNPSAPAIVGSVTDATQLSSVNSVFVSGKYAYVTASGNRVTIVDVSFPTSPAIVSTITDSTRLATTTGISVSGKYAYVKASGYLTILDVSDPTAPFVIGSLNDATNLATGQDIYVSGRYAYVAVGSSATNNRLTIVDVSTPSSPFLAGTINDNTNLRGALSVYVSGRYAYLTSYTNNRLTIVDVSNPASLSVTGSLSDATNLSNPIGIYVSGKYAYVVANGAARLTVVDISTPATPTVATSIQNSTTLLNPQGVFVSGKYAYVASPNYLTVVDISGIDAPSATIGNLAASDITVWDNLDVGNNLYVRGGLGVGGNGILSQGPITISSTSSAQLVLNGKTTGKALAIFNETGNQAIFTASSSGTTRFIIANDGNVGLGGQITPLTALDVTGSASLSANISLRGSGTAHTFNVLDNGTFNFQRSIGGDAGLASTMFLQNNGTIGFGTTAPLANIDIRANSTFGGTIPVASVSGKTSFAALVVDNSGAGDIFTASSSGQARFTVQGDGNSGLGVPAGFSDNPIKLADPASLPASHGRGVGFSPDGTYLAVTYDTGSSVNIYKRSGDTFTKLADPATLPAGNGRGASFSPDGTYLAVTHTSSPFVSIYKRAGDTFTKLSDPATLPAGAPAAAGVSFSANGTYLAIAHATSPFVTIYKRSGDTFTKIPNPATLPPNTGAGASFSPDGTYLAITHLSSPFVTIYKRSGDTFTKIGNPASLPANTAVDASFSPDGTYLAVTNITTSPYITIYKRSGDTFTKLANPATLPANSGRGVGFSPDGIYLAVSHDSSPFVTIYKRSNDDFSKITNPATLPANDGNAGGVAFSPSGTYLAVTNITTSPFITIYKGSGSFIHKFEIAMNPPDSMPSSPSGGLSFGKEVALYRGAPYTLSLASGNSFDIGFGTLRMGGVETINSQRNATLNNLVVNADTTLIDSGISSMASISGQTSFAGLVVDNSGTGDLFTASSSGVTQFVIRNNGAIGIGTSIPLAQLDVRGDATVSGNLTLAGGARSIQTTAFNTLTLGGSTTGNILVNPRNGTAGGFFAPVTDNVTDLGASPSARFRSLFLGPSSLHVQCTTGDGCAQGLDYALGVNTSTGTFSIAVNGTTATGNPLLNITQGGNVGIGNTSPGAMLSVGSSTPALVSSAGLITVANTTDSTSGSTGSINTAGGLGVTKDLAVDGGDLVTAATTFNLLNATATTVNFAGAATTLTMGATTGTASIRNATVNFPNATAIGIGNTAPLAALDVTGSASLSANISLRGSGTAHTFNILDNGSLNFQRSIGGDTGLAANSVLYLQNTGNVGIGTTAPTTRLSVDGDLSFVGTQTITTTTGNIIISPTTGSIGFGASPNARTFVGYGGLGDHAWSPISSTGANQMSYVVYRPASITMNASGDTGTMSMVWLGQTTLNHAGADNSTLGATLFVDAPVAGATGTFTNMSTFYVSDAPSGGSTSNYSLWVDAGTSRLDGNVGIGGQTLPLTALDVTGSASLSANISLRGSGTAHTFNILDNGSLNFQRSIGGDTGLAANSVLYLQNTGNIGIGTTAPSQKLEVSGTTLLNGRTGINLTPDANAILRFGWASSGATKPSTLFSAMLETNSDADGFGIFQNDEKSSRIIFGSPSNNVSGYFSFSNSATAASRKLVLSASGSDQIVLLNNGNFGVGNNTPLTALDVTGSASLSANLSLRGSGTAHTFNILDNGSLNIQKSIGGDAGLATALYIQNSGNVGIGDATPANLFAVGSGDLFQVDSSGRVFLPAGASGAGNLALSTTGDTNTGLYFSAADEIRIQTGGSDRVTINSGGNVGLGGQTTPLTALDVTGSASLSANISLRGSGTAHTFNILQNGSLNFQRSIGGDGTLSSTMFFQNDGNVGIGTAVPKSLLSIANNSWISTIDNAGTGAINMFKSNASDQIQVGAALSIDGGLIFPTDGGAVTAADMPLTGSAANSYTFRLASTNVLSISGTGDGSGGLTSFGVGVGTTSAVLRLDVWDSQSASAAAQIYNTNDGTNADGLIVKLGNSSTTAVNAANHFVSFETFGIGIVGSVQGSGGKGVTYATSGIADFAEYFKKEKSSSIPFGSVVCFDNSGLAVACDNNSNKIIGVASETPAFLGGENLGDRSIAVGLVGQVRTRVSTANGEIKIGDPLTTSSIPGVAVKATSVGQILGKAIQGYDGQGEGKILVSVNITWYNPSIYVSYDGTLAGMAATVGSIGDQLTLQGQQLALQGDALQAQSASISAQLAAQTNYVLANDPLFDSLNNKVSDLESKINLLSEKADQQASISAFLTEIVNSQVLGVTSNATAASTSAGLNLGDVEIYSATISDNLMVLGRTTVTDLGVTGSINAGLLAIHGLDPSVNSGQGGATISTLAGDLYIQHDGLGGVDILNGKIVMDTKGNLTVAGTLSADTVEAKNYTVLGDQSIGSGTIPAGSTSIEISTSIASESSKIFLTSTSLTDKQITVVSKKDGKFKVAIPEPTTSPISFDWWIVGNK